MKPILFNTEIVRAILESRKTVTRRVVKLEYSNTHLKMFTNKYGTRLIEKQNFEPGVTVVKHPDGSSTRKLLAYIEKMPPYRPGDILYVRETWEKARKNRNEFEYIIQGECTHTRPVAHQVAPLHQYAPRSRPAVSAGGGRAGGAIATNHGARAVERTGGGLC